MYVERALFVVAPQDSGKSTQLRSLFLDRRFGTNGQIPPSTQQRNLTETYCIGNNRQLFLRLTSPHEYGDTPQQFHQKIRRKTDDGRWCIAGAFQPDAFKLMPDVVESIRLFQSEFVPERIRIIFLSPTRHGVSFADYSSGRDLTSELQALSRVEVVLIDARNREANGLLIADFFDFS
jgi:hypothetical protein